MKSKQAPPQGSTVQFVRPFANPPLWYAYQGEYSALEHISTDIAKSHRLSLHQEAIYSLLDSLSPYRISPEDLPDAVVEARITVIRLAIHFLDQLVIANPLLLPTGYEITNKDNYLSLIRSPYGGVTSLRTDSMAPLLPEGTAVAYFQLQPSEWKQTKEIVSVYLYSDYDTETVGLIGNVTDETFTLKRKNPTYPDVVIPWSDVVRILGLYFLVGDRIEADYE